MDNLQEAYLNVYGNVDEATAMAKRGYDEVPIRQQIAKNTRGGEAADRATRLAQNSTFRGPESQKARENLARKQRGNFRNTTSSNPGLHGYAHRSDDPKVKAKQSARAAQRSALTPSERKMLNMGDDFDVYDLILSHLLDEGYATTEDAATAIMANMSETWRDEILDEAKSDAGLSDKEKRAERRKRNETSGLDFFHTISRGKKKVPGRKTSYDKEGNMIRKYKHMQDAKRAAQKDAENAEYNERQRVQSKGTWYKD